ncbi:RnfABCDGE type electron transport complex subunit B [Breznakiella homolactica]|uniref:Ion-translocating oxidoreductase complex subunit B n=1 Tax=Breznakiella homolactica TaxID=2798577 RepID=A0A7T7XNZ6_9SPIR|nr:RnfABCDGE type electron transport complex subunit B [Breznakiella homolactica]QQO09855.1 RnfABCDGE type electron transport complex subunit B [Breznakiella homolactica]
MNIVLLTALFAAALALILGLALGFFKEFFKVEEDPMVAKIRELLPGANCGACGYPGCDGYAKAIASGEADVTRCAPGGKATVDSLCQLLGVSASATSIVAVLACQGSKEHAPVKGDYIGVPTCRGAKISTGGTKLCSWGCLGFGDCTMVCPFDAIHMGGDGLPHVDYAKCTGCKKCIIECPQQIIKEVPRERKGSMVICSNRNPIKAMVMKTCKVGCIKCEICVKNCPEKCITMENGIPVVDYSKCTSCGVCVAKCPTKVFKMLQDDIITDKKDDPKCPEPSEVATGDVSAGTAL